MNCAHPGEWRHQPAVGAEYWWCMRCGATLEQPDKDPGPISAEPDPGVVWVWPLLVLLGVLSPVIVYVVAVPR